MAENRGVLKISIRLSAATNGNSYYNLFCRKFTKQAAKNDSNKLEGRTAGVGD